MKPQDSFTKDDPRYPGMVGLVAAVTATDCKCSRCERLRGFLPSSLDTSGLKKKTYDMYEGYLKKAEPQLLSSMYKERQQGVTPSNVPLVSKSTEYRNRLRQTPEGQQKLQEYENQKRKKYQQAMGTPEHAARKEQMRAYINKRRQEKREKRL